MKVSDYIVEFLIKKGITDIFGYPGGMVTQLMDSFGSYSDKISAHVTYHEQGAALAACGYAQTSGKPGIAYATSGPGATNLITGIADAFFDSIPTIFITGQVNSNEARGILGVRQRGFQETDIVSVVKPITKYAVYVESAEKLITELDKAYEICISDRKGPVLLDIPMNIFRQEVSVNANEIVPNETQKGINANIQELIEKELSEASAPVFLIGAGIKSAFCENRIRDVLSKLNIPVVSSMIAFDIMKSDPNYFGFIGAYGTRAANFIVAKADLVISVGSRVDIRQVGACREKFAPNARILRFDIDDGELEYKVHKDEHPVKADIDDVILSLEKMNVADYSNWFNVCEKIRELLSKVDDNKIAQLMKQLSDTIPDDVNITTDVGQNQVWVAQSFKIKSNQKVLFSGGHGAMGYSLPASIGAYYGSGKKSVYCITGDGGLQMNIQELQFIAREQLPIKIIVLNNNALGMIRHFQEMYFDGRYVQTVPIGGYTSPDFEKIAKAYGINAKSIELNETASIQWGKGPELLQIMIREDTYVTPKLEFGKPNQDQEPLIDRNLYDRLMAMSLEDFQDNE